MDESKEAESKCKCKLESDRKFMVIQLDGGAFTCRRYESLYDAQLAAKNISRRLNTPVEIYQLIEIVQKETA